MICVFITNIRKFNDEKIVNDILSNISSYRREKYLASKNEEVKSQVIASSYLIDEYLKTLGLREKDMIYEFGRVNKPCFVNNEKIKFNISHSKSLVGVAFSDREVGFDIQAVKKVSDKIYDYVLSDDEKKDVFNVVDDNEKIEKFFRYWVMKEAILKRNATGLIREIKDVCDDYGMLGVVKVSKEQIIFEDTDNNLNPDNSNDCFEKYYFCVNNSYDKEFKINVI